jgi:M6 family metalloprotease-like protein
MESPDGYTLMYAADKSIVYAEQDMQGNLVPSNVRFGGPSVPSISFRKGLRYSPAQVHAMKEIWKVTSDTGEGPLRSSGQQKAGATTGFRRALCVLMGFSDKAFSKNQSEFEILFNQVGLYNDSTKGSVRDFYRENSYEQLDLTVRVVGPYTAPETCQYYAADDSRYQDFAAVAARSADPDIDFNDFADNGKLETFHILFAGYGDENINNGKQIWSHKWQLTSPITLDGVTISVYSCSPELRGSRGNNTTYIGVICHELCHVFGAPDYYDTDEKSGGNYLGSGDWDLMANGSWNDNGRQPAHINMFQKILYGWVTPVELTAPTEIPDMPPSAQQPVAYTIRANDDGECYVLENRQQVGFDASTPGHGLLIWHVHPRALGGNGSNAGHPQQMYPVVASSTYQIPDGSVNAYGNINSAGTPFPGSSGKEAFTAKTTPAMFTWTGSQPIFKPLTEIREASDKTISFKFMDGPTVPVTNLNAGVLDGNVTLSWTAAGHEAVLGYKIYRDGVLQYTIHHPSTTTYTQVNVANGTYEYSVKAFYTDTESEKITINVTVSDGSDTYYFPIRNLQGSSTLDKISLNWTEPFSGGWMTIAGEAFGAYSFGSAITFFAGTLWGPEHLKGLDGYEATQVRFYLSETDNGVTYKAQIWEVNKTGTPVLVRDQSFTQSPGFTEGIKTVTFSSPLTLDASKKYIIGVEIHTLGGYCLMVDANPALPQRNRIYIGNRWSAMEEVGVKENFYTEVYFHSGNPSSKYIIYRDGAVIGESSTTAFEDLHVTPATTYSYCVSAVYDNDRMSESACMELTTLPGTSLVPVSDASVLKIYPNPVKSGQDFYVQTETPGMLIRIYSLAGTLVKQQRAAGMGTKMNVTLPAGIYILSAGGEKTKIMIQ